MTDLIVGKTNVTKLIDEHIPKQNGKWVFMLEVPEENYFDVNTETVKVIVDSGYQGLYISLHRPYQNLVSRLEERAIDTDRLFFIDAASSQAGGKTPDETERCYYISRELDVDELTRAVYKMLEKIEGGDKFLFLDSITTLFLYVPLSESMRFAEFISRKLTKKEVNGVVVNVAKGLSQKKFIKDIMLHVDEIIPV